MIRTFVGQIALRYFRGKGSANAVPILSRISMVAIAVAAAAMIVLFSVFNGFESLVKSLYTAFYPDIKVTAARGKFFAASAHTLQSVAAVDGVQSVTASIEDNVLVNSGDDYTVVTLKGIDTYYMSVNNIKPFIIEGDSSFTTPVDAIMGARIAKILSANVYDPVNGVTCYYPGQDISQAAANPEAAFRSVTLHPAGVFRIQDEFDNKYILAPIDAVQQLLGRPGRYTSIEIKVKPGYDLQVERALKELLGTPYLVASRYEQNKTLYMVMSLEKWVVYAILLLVLLIASFNMVGALLLLVVEKRKDLAILRAMGAQGADIRRIFFGESLLWSLTGGIAGIVLGVVLCVVQMETGIVKLADSFLVDAYPVKMQATDFLLVLATVIVVALLAAWYPATRATSAQDPSLKSA
jgi:lipoprotein-releasing system permease protein